jgi:hypothetical protein
MLGPIRFCKPKFGLSKALKSKFGPRYVIDSFYRYDFGLLRSLLACLKWYIIQTSLSKECDPSLNRLAN